MVSKQLKLVAAGVGATAVVAMGALGVVLAEEPQGVATYPVVSEATLGDTATQEPAGSTPETTFAEPEVKAEVPDGYDQEPD
jgi:hypothetical protein